jgi:hypothetical protein
MRIICYMIWMKINLLLASANSIARHRKRVYMDDGSSWSVLRGVTTGGVWGGCLTPPIFRNGTLAGQKLRKGRAKLLKI